MGTKTSTVTLSTISTLVEGEIKSDIGLGLTFGVTNQTDTNDIVQNDTPLNTSSVSSTRSISRTTVRPPTIESNEERNPGFQGEVIDDGSILYSSSIETKSYLISFTLCF